MRNIDFSDKELVLLYILLKGLPPPEDVTRVHLTSRIEKILFDFMTIGEVENITDYFHSLS